MTSPERREAFLGKNPIKTETFIVKAKWEGKPLDFKVYEKMGYDILDPVTKKEVTSFYEGQIIETRAGLEDGVWTFKVVCVTEDAITAENEDNLLLAMRRVDGSWGASFANRQAWKEVNFTDGR